MPRLWTMFPLPIISTPFFSTQLILWKDHNGIPVIVYNQATTGTRECSHPETTWIILTSSRDRGPTRNPHPPWFFLQPAAFPLRMPEIPVPGTAFQTARSEI